MIRNYLKIAFRNIIRHKAFTAINIAGLAIGMTCSIFIFLWVQNERSYDRFHKNADEIYRITARAGEFNAAVNCAGMPAELKAKIPAVENFVRLSHPSTNVVRHHGRVPRLLLAQVHRRPAAARGHQVAHRSQPAAAAAGDGRRRDGEARRANRRRHGFR